MNPFGLFVSPGCGAYIYQLSTVKTIKHEM